RALLFDRGQRTSDRGLQRLEPGESPVLCPGSSVRPTIPQDAAFPSPELRRGLYPFLGDSARREGAPDEVSENDLLHGTTQGRAGPGGQEHAARVDARAS